MSKKTIHFDFDGQRSETGSRNETPMPASLHEDVMLNILVMLPVKSVIRFKCVSKSFYAMLSTKSFATAHLKHHKECAKTTRYLCLFGRCTDIGEQIYKDIAGFYDEMYPYVFNEFDIPSVIPNNFRCYGSCDGLLLISEPITKLDSNLYIWNPAIRRVKVVPKTSYPKSHLVPPKSEFTRYAFGFDTRSCDYKVVRLVIFAYNYNMKFQVDVYSVNSNSWGRTYVCPVFGQGGPAKLAFVNGIVYWDFVFLNKDQLDRKIMSFDIGSEGFEELSLHASIPKTSYSYLRNFGGLISLVVQTAKGIGGKCSRDIWSLQAGSKGSWRRRFAVDLSYPGRGIWLTTNDEALVTWDLNDNRLVSCNRNGSEANVLGLLKAFDRPDEFIEPFIESLVLLDHDT